MEFPLLSIVIPTGEGLKEHWLEQLLKVEGPVEIILVHPPSLAKLPIEDTRVKQINAFFRGEISQRMTGLLNATGTYVLSMNCDEYITPKILDWTQQYFQRFPDSWVMRLKTQSYKYGDREKLDAPWGEIPEIKTMKVFHKSNKSIEGEGSYNDFQDLLEIPIVPLANNLDILALFRDRTDERGLHIENFDKKVWKISIVQATVQDLSNYMTIFGPFKYVPFWSLDRLLGLSLQAKFFEPNKIIGHWLPYPEQLRAEDNPPEYPRTDRFYVIAEILLLKHFSQYNYIWNLILDHLRLLPKGIIKYAFYQLSRKR